MIESAVDLLLGSGWVLCTQFLSPYAHPGVPSILCFCVLSISVSFTIYSSYDPSILFLCISGTQIHYQPYLQSHLMLTYQNAN
jgi:hypothetical protein